MGFQYIADAMHVLCCKAFEDNSGAMEFARTPNMSARTKLINLVYHYFREYVH